MVVQESAWWVSSEWHGLRYSSAMNTVTELPTPEVSLSEFTLNTLIAEIAEQSGDPKQAAIQRHIHAVNVLGLTLDGEGRGEALQGRSAIAWTVKNRQLKYPRDKDKSIPEICLRRLQYSCWWEVGGKQNYDRTLLMAQSIYGVPKASVSNFAAARLSESLYLAAGVIGGQIEDPTSGATHYCTRQVYASGAVAWARGDKLIATFGSHMFFRGIA